MILQNKDQSQASAKLTSNWDKMGQKPLIFQPGCPRTTRIGKQNVIWIF
jgi:hypothetical protein